MFNDSVFYKIQGSTINSISGLKKDSYEVTIETSIGKFKLYHYTDVSEKVCIVQIDGDPDDLIGAYVTSAYEAVSKDTSKGTWTFYHICTPKGDLCIRWLGESNGYYSESVDVQFEELGEDDKDSENEDIY